MTSFNTSFLVTEKLNKDIEDFNYTINKLHLTDLNRLQPQQWQNAHFFKLLKLTHILKS